MLQKNTHKPIIIYDFTTNKKNIPDKFGKDKMKKSGFAQVSTTTTIHN